jgi:prevent-host-death family protein
MKLRTWTITAAKAKLGEVVKRAASEGPQTITRNGRKVAVVLGEAELNLKSKRVDNLAEFFAKSPLRNSGLKTRRFR